ncbi:antibiotic biosynthesis monooxygenase [Myxococcus sp. CA040A]|uniref:antibiotic biosynthesis monooxygenase family protein n=1 Tax=Myxococcus sp. CA040A TaxID=2741738 RepID=UPI00157B1A87|nr:antibiotic biosynthesis monooxygenase [Myxococcus sp. CA040A]
MLRRLATAALASLLVACTASRAARATPENTSPMKLTIDLEQNPDIQFRIDRFSVPDAARPELEAAIHRSTQFLRTQPGFLGHIVLERRNDTSGYNLMTVAAWESPDALDKAGAEARAYYERIGVDVPAMLSRLGVKMERGNYHAPLALQ